MPTNKLWIEHTERAAWQSVDALREKLVEAERRISRMAPPVEGWSDLLEALDAARRDLSLQGETYADLSRGALSELAEARARVQLLEAEVARRDAVKLAPAPGPTRLDTPTRRFTERRATPDDDEDDEIGSPALSRAEPRLFQEIRQRYKELAGARSHFDGEALLLEISNRLDEIPDLDAGEIADAAADLAALSLRLTRARTGSDESE
jgi:hypothetical protein